MSSEHGALSPRASTIVREEEALLARARAALERAEARAAARPRQGDLRSTESLRALRDEVAAATDEDDLPALLLEMAVRQRLRAQPEDAALPDRAAPYLAHLRVAEGGQRRDYLLGRATLLDPAEGVRIVDWRVAPVAQIFYRYREGDAYEEDFPGRVAEGVVEARRLVVFEEGRLVRIVGDGIALQRDADGSWRETERTGLALSPGGAGTAARPGVLGVGAGAQDRAAPIDVTALLDAEQIAAIKSPPDTPLLVLGSAGSGKTTVALHRLAQIVATDPGRYPLAATRVIVPEEGLCRLSRRLLEPLGVGRAQVRTLDAWAKSLATQAFAGAPIALSTEAPALVSSLKRHPALYEALRARLDALPAAAMTLRKLRHHLATLFTDRAFLGEVVAASGGDLSRAAIEETVRHTMLQLAEPLDRQLRSVIVPEMKTALDGLPIAEGTPDALAGTLDLEDLPILLFLKAAKGALAAPAIAHLVLDEAEDFALFELFVLGRMLGARPSLTLAGDEAQQTLSSFAGWDTMLSTVGARDTARCRLGVSYRCPRPVVDLARAILGPLAPEAPARAAREGAPVGRLHLPDEAQALMLLAGAVGDLVDREPRASVAVIAHSEDAARRAHALLADRPEARLALRGELSFEPGIDVTCVESCKGLEFDYVVIPDATAEAYPDTPEARRKLAVAVTRASHQLWVMSGGAPSPLLPG
ncbi:MAG: ATP-binding domain-containing protein [Byssovorax sp.]